MGIINNKLMKIDRYLISIEKNVNDGDYLMEVGIPPDWVCKETNDIKYDTISESDKGSIIKVMGKHADINIDHLVEYIIRVIDLNEEITQMTEKFKKDLEEKKKMLQDEVLKAKEEIDKKKDTFFDDDGKEKNVSSKTNDRKKVEEKEELEKKEN